MDTSFAGVVWQQRIRRGEITIASCSIVWIFRLVFARSSLVRMMYAALNGRYARSDLGIYAQNR